MENDHFLKRLDAGLATLQNIDMCIAEVCFQMGASTRDRIAQLLKLKGGDFSTVGRIVQGKTPYRSRRRMWRGFGTIRRDSTALHLCRCIFARASGPGVGVPPTRFR